MLDRRLSELGLSRERGPRRLSERSSISRTESLGRLAVLLTELGPFFVGFGRYLGSRPDLLRESDLSALRAGLPTHAGLLDSEVVAAKIAAALPAASGRVVAALDPLPVASGIASQRHRALLHDGRQVAIDVLHPVEPGEADFALLHELLEKLRAGQAELGLEAADVVDFQANLAAGGDLRLRAAAFAALARCAATTGVRVPTVVEELSSREILVWEWIEGAPLGERPTTGDEVGSPYAGLRSSEVAGNLLTRWLHQVLSGEPYPIDLDPSDIWISKHGELFWTGGIYTSLPASARDALWRYLLAALGQDPDRALEALLEEMTATAGADRDRLQKRLRQLVPVRDGGLGTGEELSAYLFMHWHGARTEGFRPRPHLLAFERGLSALAASVRPAVAGSDPVREAIERVQLLQSMSAWGQMIDLGRLGQSTEEALRVMAVMPERLNRLLDLAEQGRFTVRLEMSQAPSKSRQLSTEVVGLLLAMVSIAILAPRLSDPALLGVWSERLAAVLLVVFGVVLLRRLGRGSS